MLQGLPRWIVIALAGIFGSSAACDTGRIPSEPAGRDNSAAAIHKRILVLDGWLGSGSMPCRAKVDDLLSTWEKKGIDAGIWWVRGRGELLSVHCWMSKHKDQIVLATRSADAPRFHTQGRRSLYIGIINAPADELGSFYRAGARFARAPNGAAEPWLAEAHRLGMSVDAAAMAPATLARALAVDGPPFLFGWSRASGEAPAVELTRGIARRDGVLLMLPAFGEPVTLDDMRDCLRHAPWDHCAIGGAADPEGLTTGLLESGLSEGNVARMYGFNILRVLRKWEISSRQR